MARILQEDIPAAHSQQHSLPCLCSAPVPWLCKHFFFFFFCKRLCTNKAVCVQTLFPSFTGEHSPERPFHPSPPEGRSRCQHLSEAHHTTVPPNTGAHIPCHVERDMAAANPICEAAEPEKCQAHLAVSGRPAPLALVIRI